MLSLEKSSAITTTTGIIGNVTNSNSITTQLTTGTNNITLAADGTMAIDGGTWEAPLNISAVTDKYFDLQGRVKQNAKEFIDAISKLDGVTDNFKVVKLYKLLRDRKHDEFKKVAKEYVDEYNKASTSSYSFPSSSDTGIYMDGSDSITLTVGGSNTIIIGK